MDEIVLNLKIKEKDKAEFLGQIIDIFEDFLEDKGINIPNEDRDQDEDGAIIYGEDYDVLRSQIESTLVAWE